MSSRVDKIINTFVKTANNLVKEADRLTASANVNETRAQSLIEMAAEDRSEAARAERIVSKLEEIING